MHSRGLMSDTAKSHVPLQRVKEEMILYEKEVDFIAMFESVALRFATLLACQPEWKS